MPTAVNTVAFALVVVQHPDNERFCLVHEKQDRGWWLPGGGVDAGQTFAEAAVREAQEEAGVDCELAGVLRIECTAPAHGRLRVIFYARPKGQSLTLKTKPDHHSRGARWVTLEELDAISNRRRGVVPGVPDETCYLRGSEPLDWFHYVAKGGTVYPLSILEIYRLGEVPAEWEGPGDAPRAFYATNFSISVACISSDRQVALHQFRRQLPELDVTEVDVTGLNVLADSFSKQLGGGPISGLCKVRHILDISAVNPNHHTCSMNVIYTVDYVGSLPKGCEWVPLTDIQHVVVVHNNLALRQHIEGWRELGWNCSFFDKEDFETALEELQTWRGAALICTSTFPLQRLRPAFRAVIWSKTAASDSHLRAGLLSLGASHVATDVEPSHANFASLLAAVEAIVCPYMSGMHNSIRAIDSEGVPPRIS